MEEWEKQLDMSAVDRKSLINENRRLKQRLDVAQDELINIKSSRAYSAIRLAGHARDQVKKSPLGFAKTVVRKLASRSFGSGVLNTQKNISLQGSQQEQYKEWIIFNEPDAKELEMQAQEASKFKERPLISIITPVFNPPKEVFIELIESVLAQSYDNFELCLGNFGDNEEIKDVIKEYAGKDSRIKNFIFKDNEGIAGNSNQILKKVTGSYVALLDHDDTLSPNALYENVKLINEADYDFIYSDKDKIDDKGVRFDPFFKPDWSPEIMLNANYLTHLNVMKTSLVKKAGAWDSATDGAQDWDLFLKVIAVSKLVGHIPKVLYHWRVIATSTAFSIETKPYALQGQRNAVDTYLKKINVSAETYHEGAELLINWKGAKKKPLLIVTSTSITGLRAFLLSAKNLAIYKKVVVFHNYPLASLEEELNEKAIETHQYSEGYTKQVRAVLEKQEGDVIFVSDKLKLDISQEDVASLQGWLSIEGVRAVSPRIINHQGVAIDCGAVITPEGIRPIFAGSPPYHQAPIGNIEWIRNLRVLSPLLTVVRASDARSVFGQLTKLDIEDDYVISALHLLLSKESRLVFNTKVRLQLRSGIDFDAAGYYEEASVLLESVGDSGLDVYFNPNLSSSNPMNITNIEQNKEAAEPLPEQIYGYHNEAMIHALNRRLTSKELDANFEHIRKSSTESLGAINTAIVILPDFQAIYAGLNNIFFFADKLRKQYGAKITFALLADDMTFARQEALIAEKYPELAEHSSIIGVSHDTVNQLPEADIAVCTQWATAYILALYNKTKRKCYFIQDKEGSFYPKGSISALVDNTYTFGFYGLANTDGLLDWYSNEFNGTGSVLRSQLDIANYAPPKDLKIAPKGPYKVFFYARPNEPRNAFEIGIAGLIELKKRLKDQVEIYAAGAEWDPHDYGLNGVIENLGKIAYSKLPSFYRSMDAGVMMMFSGHPGVVASELMASGTPAIVNVYDDVTWHDLYRDGETAIVTRVTADEVADSIESALKDSKLRSKVIKGGLDKVADFYGRYDESLSFTIGQLQAPLNTK